MAITPISGVIIPIYDDSLASFLGPCGRGFEFISHGCQRVKHVKDGSQRLIGWFHGFTTGFLGAFATTWEGFLKNGVLLWAWQVEV